ncbi:MAG TPA: apolipoprotein N-acyltransferase [Pyrinomonadaceae bacterium]|nr:apolipoprotein N-acyltransferase [Pyrinomonadaceae bacterium]
MQHAVVTPSHHSSGSTKFSRLANRVHSDLPPLSHCLAALVSAVVLIVSFPDFEIWPLAWISLVPLLWLVARNPKPWNNFLLGWIFGIVFFYFSCYWLTYSIIHTGGISPVIAFLLLIPGAILLGIFPALFTLFVARIIKRWGPLSLLAAPLVWAALEWGRLEITGQLWNAIGYSQAYHPLLIQTAKFGGVYAVGFMIVWTNAAIAYLIVVRTKKATLISFVNFAAVGLVLLVFAVPGLRDTSAMVLTKPDLAVVAVQPNVPVEPIVDSKGPEALTTGHIAMSASALQTWELTGQVDNFSQGSVESDWAKDNSVEGREQIPRLVIWPESPMNFAYGSDDSLRAKLVPFARANHTSLLLNSQEIAPNDGIYNSALLINEQGSLVAQYDKIRLLPFGEYVPLPQWLPGTGLIRGIVGDFAPGTNYRLMPIGKINAGVFICIESAYPSIARRFTAEGAAVLINISNDGYLGPTPVMRQHLANAIFRAVENERPLLRVTNTGITAFISHRGVVLDATQPFKPDLEIWTVTGRTGQTFYTRFGDLFAVCCGLLSLTILAVSFSRTRKV